MRAATAKATRRDIRRAVGADGLAAVNATAYAVHDEILPRLDKLEAAAASERRRLTELDAEVGLALDHLGGVEVREAQLASSFLERLRWLFTGRF